MSDYTEKCCLAPGTYTLDCKCSYGDGWHEGYLEIDGVKYCNDFSEGYSKTVEVTIVQGKVPISNLKSGFLRVTIRFILHKL